MFCAKCGEKLEEGIVFCPKCGTKAESNDQVSKYPIQSTNGNSGHNMNMKMIISIGGLLLCVLFFVAPLVQCSQANSLSATGLEISTGTGDLMGNAEKSYPYVFVLLIFPIILVILGFLKKSFAVLRNFSIGGLAVHIIFMIGAYAMVNSGDYKGAFELTGFNWLIIVLYIGIIGFSLYCIKKGYESIQNRILDPKKDGLAIASLISGIIGLLISIGSIVGIVTGYLD